MKKPKITPEEKQAIIDMFNAMPTDAPSRYALIAKKMNKSTSSVFTIIKASVKKEPEVKYFDPKIFQF